MQRLALGSLLLLLAACGSRLTPEQVRGLLDAPAGTVSQDTMALATRDLFLADSATSVENFAQLTKGNAGEGGAAGGIGGGDVVCVGALVASIATFDTCALGDECKDELTIDSCALRIGAGDEDARGKINLLLENVVDDAFDRSTLAIEFDGWENTREAGLLDTLGGSIALESTRATDDSSIELLFAADLDVNVKRKERALFDDGIEEHANFLAGLRFQASQTADAAEGSLEVLAFADTDGGREQSLAIRLSAEGHRVNAAQVTAGAALEVIGENGTFTCTWSAAESIGAHDGVTVTSQGECVDVDGGTFSFSGEASSD